MLTRNPLVNKALYALRPTINAIIKRHNLAHIPYVHVEMARELKKSEAERDAIANRQRKQEQTNDLFYAELRALGANTNNKDNFVKYALWIECDRRCVYTAKTIGKKDLFELGKYEIEHIIPRTPKDSRMENLTLCEKRKNQEKGGRTPYQAFGHTHEWEMMTEYARKHFSFRKYQRFISEKEPRESYEMTQKDLNLTGYIAKEVAAYLRQVSGNIYFTKGGITALLRQQWGLDTLLAPPISMPDKDSFHEIVTSQDPSPSYLPGRYYLALKEDNEVIAYTPYNPALTGRSFEEIQKDLKEAYADKNHAKSKEKKAKEKAEKDAVKKEVKQIDSHIKDLYKELAEAQKKTQKERESIFKIENTKQSGSLPAMVQSVFKELYPIKTTWPKFYVLSGEIHLEDSYGKPIPPTFVPDEAKNRSDHRHHIVDALVIAATRLADTQAYNRKSGLGATYNTLQEVVVPLPWTHFKDEAEALLSQVFMYRRPTKEPLQEKVKKKVKVPIYPDPLARQPQKKHRWVVAQGDSARGELHNETYYGKCKSPEGKVGYHHRKSIEEVKSTQVAKVVDKAIRDKMYELIEQTGGKITKDTFYDIKKEDNKIVKRTPKLYLSNKRENGQPVPVKKVRISEQSSKVTQLSPSYNRWVEPSGNYLSGIYLLKDGSWKDYVYTLKEAIDLRKSQAHNLFPPPARTFSVKVKRSKERVLEEAPLVLTLQRNNLVMLDPPAFLREGTTFNLNLLNQNQLAAISESTYRLQKLSQIEDKVTGIRKSGSYVFRKHMAATIDIPMQSVTVVPSSLQKLYPIKVIVDSLGKICQLIDPIRQKKWSIE